MQKHSLPKSFCGFLWFSRGLKREFLLNWFLVLLALRFNIEKDRKPVLCAKVTRGLQTSIPGWFLKHVQYWTAGKHINLPQMLTVTTRVMGRKSTFFVSLVSLNAWGIVLESMFMMNVSVWRASQFCRLVKRERKAKCDGLRGAWRWRKLLSDYLIKRELFTSSFHLCSLWKPLL